MVLGAGIVLPIVKGDRQTAELNVWPQSVCDACLILWQVDSSSFPIFAKMVLYTKIDTENMQN